MPTSGEENHLTELFAKKRRIRLSSQTDSIPGILVNYDSSLTEVDKIKRQVLSENVSPESPKHGNLNPNIQGLQVKSYSFYGDEENSKIQSGRDINFLQRSEFLQPADQTDKERAPRNAPTRSNGTMLSQSTHHSPARKYDNPSVTEQRGTQGPGKQYSAKNSSVKDEISRFSYKRLVNHLEKKYQDIRSIFKSDANVPRAQARLASPSPSPTPKP